MMDPRSPGLLSLSLDNYRDLFLAFTTCGFIFFLLLPQGGPWSQKRKRKKRKKTLELPDWDAEIMETKFLT